MPAKAPPSDLPIYSFPSTKELETFLEREHAAVPGFHLKFAKKLSGIASVSAAEAVEIALCFGWIDGQANGFDDQHWLVRYTPRRPKSIWSQKNVSTIGRLLEEGRVRPAGLAAVEAAKADGRWERAYAGPATMTIPDDFAAALAANAAASGFMETLNKTNRYAVLWRVQTASPQSRAKRIEAMVQMLAEGKLPGPSVKQSHESRKHATGKTAKTKQVAAKKLSAHRQARDSQPERCDQAKRPRRAGLRQRP
ncbi:MAG: hypothetical protein Q9160_000374 [Pyrenula sp. 1 TL-2023]